MLPMLSCCFSYKLLLLLHRVATQLSRAVIAMEKRFLTRCCSCFMWCSYCDSQSSEKGSGMGEGTTVWNTALVPIVYWRTWEEYDGSRDDSGGWIIILIFLAYWRKIKEKRRTKKWSCYTIDPYPHVGGGVANWLPSLWYYRCRINNCYTAAAVIC